MNWSGRNVLITGGAGHIGSHLAAELVKKGANVRIADNLWRGKKEYLFDENNKPIIDFEKQFLEVDLREMKNCEKVVFMGFLRGGNLVYRWAELQGIDFYYIDRPYWGESRRTPYFMRCTKNAHVKIFNDNRPDDRFKKSFKDA